MDNRTQTLIRRSGLDYKGGIGPAKQKAVVHDNVESVLSSLPEFSADVLSENVLQKLIQQAITVDVHPGDSDVYTQGKPETFCVIVVKGSLQMEEGGQVSTKGAGAVIGLRALQYDTYVPEFTLSARQASTILKITKRSYTAALQATEFERGGDPEQFDDF